MFFSLLNLGKEISFPGWDNLRWSQSKTLQDMLHFLLGKYIYKTFIIFYDVPLGMQWSRWLVLTIWRHGWCCLLTEEVNMFGVTDGFQMQVLWPGKLYITSRQWINWGKVFSWCFSSISLKIILHEMKHRLKSYLQCNDLQNVMLRKGI